MFCQIWCGTHRCKIPVADRKHRSQMKMQYSKIFHLFSVTESPDEGGSGLEEEGSGILSVMTVTESPQVFFRTTTTESEAVGEVETLQPTVVDFTYTMSPSQLPLPQPPSVTQVLTDQIEAATAQPDTGSEMSTAFVLPPTGQ